jgi:hypothetical protein
MSAPFALLTALVVARADTAPPVVAFPEPGLDDPSAYAGYTTRVYRDTRGNAFQIYLDGRTGRVVHLWADAADESVGFSLRDSTGGPATLAWGPAGTVVDTDGPARSVRYVLELPPQPVSIGLFLLGSMRVERDFQYQGRDSLPLEAVPFPRVELSDLIANLDRLDESERSRQLSLLQAGSVSELRGRLEPRVAVRSDDSSWVVRVEHVSFDGRNRLSLRLAGDAREASVRRAGPTIVLSPRGAGPVHMSVEVTTDAAALTPLEPDEIFNDDFRRFVAGARADTLHPLRFRRLDREIRGFTLLSYREKLLAGLPNFATYFGRDMLMTAQLMRPVWQPGMAEYVIASAVARLSPDGDVSHEEALGGQAIRENASGYNRLLAEYWRRLADRDTTRARLRLEQARAVLGDLQAVRQNYVMVDDDFQLPVVLAAYLTDERVPAERKRRFLLEHGRLARLAANLGLVVRRADPYVRHPVPGNLVGFPRSVDGGWISASWRDSRSGYGGGRFAMDVNVVWVPRALESLGRILDALADLGFTRESLDTLAPEVGQAPLANYVRDRAALRQAVATWRDAGQYFQVSLAPREVRRRVAARLGRLPAPERAYWDSVFRVVGPPTDTLRFLALSLDDAGRPIPILSTDPAMLLLEPQAPARVRRILTPIMLRYPVGLFVEDLGPLVANDAYASRRVWDAFARDAYHSPKVVWGREVNMLLAGLATQAQAATTESDRTLFETAMEHVVRAVDRSGLGHAELWSYRLVDGRLVPMRYGTSSDVQLWSLTDLVVQYLLSRSER